MNGVLVGGLSVVKERRNLVQDGRRVERLQARVLG